MAPVPVMSMVLRCHLSMEASRYGANLPYAASMRAHFAPMQQAAFYKSHDKFELPATD